MNKPVLPGAFSGENAHQILNTPPLFMDILPIAVYACDKTGSLRWFNRKAAELWGRSPSVDDEAERYCGSYRAFELDGTPLDLGKAPMAQVIAKGEAVRDREVILERPDGSRIVILANLEPVYDAGGKIAGGINCFQDITALHEAQLKIIAGEQHLQQLLQALPAAIYTTDAKGKITFYNEAAAELAGRRPELGKDEWCVTWQLFQTDGTPLPHDQCPMAQAIKEQRPIRNIEAVALRPDGRRVPFLPFPSPLRNAAGEVIGAVNMLVDITERKLAEERQKLLVDELNHRVKNTLATVQSLAAHTIGRAGLSPETHEAFEGRLLALSRTHDQLTYHGWESADLKGLLQNVFSPYNHNNIRISEESFKLSPRYALTLAMILHELATNAVKYGALSTPQGGLDVSWQLSAHDEGPRLNIDWRESGGPLVKEPVQRGFGTRFMEQSVKQQLNGNTNMFFEPAGFRCTMDIPVSVH